jgi:hypothetical protein
MQLALDKFCLHIALRFVRKLQSNLFSTIFNFVVNDQQITSTLTKHCALDRTYDVWTVGLHYFLHTWPTPKGFGQLDEEHVSDGGCRLVGR